MRNPRRVGGLDTALADRLEHTRRRTLSLFAPLSGEHLARQPSPILSPPLWDLGHIAAYEELWLARRVAGRAPLHPELDDVYDAAETPRRRRGEVRILDEREARAYLDAVRQSSLEALSAADLEDPDDPLLRDGFVFEMVAEHEAQHTETVLQALRLLPEGAYAPTERRPLPDPCGQLADDPSANWPEPSGHPAGDAADAWPKPPSVWVEIPEGPFAMGAGEDGFAYDCERPRHERELPAFLIARDPVANRDQIAFIEDGGYRRPELWTAEGWRWVQENAVDAPLSWERYGGGGWVARAFERVAPVEPERILCHVSAHEADAHARWGGARLPTEAEWERAAAGARPQDANLDQLAFGTSRRGAYAPAPSGCRHMLGDVWEWTSTAFGGYPGFRAFPYREYAEVFFGDGYRVLRGGSWATQPIAARTTFRNWDLPQRRQIFSGLRLARDLA